MDKNMFAKIKANKGTWCQVQGTSNYRMLCSFALDLTGVMNDASFIHNTQAKTHQCLWATPRYEVINHATWLWFSF